MATPQTEKQFVSTYLQLINLSSDLCHDQFNSTSDYHRLDSLGPTIPKIDIHLPKSILEGGEESKVNVKFKSIKPPYKFTAELNAVTTSNTIFKLKGDLIKTLPELQNSNITPENIKLLVKGKVSADTLPLSSLSTDADVSFMVMITPPVTTLGKSEQGDEDDENDPVISVPISLEENTWAKIYGILREDLDSEDKAKEVLSKFKSHYN